MTWILLGILVIMVAYAAHLSGTVKAQNVRIERLVREDKMRIEIYNRRNSAFMDAVKEIINELRQNNEELTLENSKMQEELKNNRKQITK